MMVFSNCMLFVFQCTNAINGVGFASLSPLWVIITSPT